MADALQTPKLPPEAVAIIQQGSPKPQTQAQVFPAVPMFKPEEPGKAAASEPRAAQEAKSSAKPTPRRTPPAEIRPALVSVCVKLPEQLPPALLKASADRKIKKVRPFTQQEIFAEAVTDWLRKNGYLE
jgi:hypothetical protein